MSRPPCPALLLALLLAPAAAEARPPAAKPPCPALVGGVRLAKSGPGWRIPSPWAERGLSWGTRDLVGLITRAAGRLRRLAPGAVLGVADLSPRRGGGSRWHRTHRHGEDVDLLFFWTDAKGQPVPHGPSMVAFDCDGRGASKDEAGNAVPPLRLDVPRTWALVRALAEDRAGVVADVLIAGCLRSKLLEHARATRAPRGVIAKAARLTRQPRFAPHNDHIHVKIAGSPERCTAPPASVPASASVPAPASAPASAPGRERGSRR
ncbi:MAG: penicillin-insensitive murein endopeptidase [Deltaproteobacteria bacterium]|nr:penicillin-insensitive murein endopeptidase [Deltaproteobacteria bacterium]